MLRVLLDRQLALNSERYATSVSAMKKIVLALAFLASSALGQQPRSVVLKAARLFDGTSDNVIRNATVIIEGNRITSIGGAVPQTPSSSTLATRRSFQASSTRTCI